MRNDDSKTVMKRKLKLFFEVISEQAAENPAFLAALERALGTVSGVNQEAITAERTPAVKRAIGPNLLEILHSGGESALQEYVDGLTTDELIKLVVQEGVRKMKEAKTLERVELISLLQEMARSRLRQGESFIRGRTYTSGA